MKILYLSSIWFSDIDISMLSELQKKVDVDYVLTIDQSNLKGCAVSIDTPYPHSGMFSPSIYPELDKFSRVIDTKKMFIQNIYHGKRLLNIGPSLGLIWASICLLWFVLKNHYDVIHTPVEPTYLRFWMFLMNKKIILANHDPLPHSGDIVSPNLKKSYRKFNHFQIFNKAQKEEFIARYHLENKHVYDSKLSVYHYLNIFNIEYNDVSDDYILFFGRISPYKGLDYLLPAMTIVHDKIPDLKLVVAGRGKYHFNIDEYVGLSYIEIRNRFIDDDELARLIAHSKFIVCPYTDATQSGVLMSCFAFNKTAIVTNVGGLPDMVGNGKYGMIVPEKNIEDLAKAIISLYQDENKLKSFENGISEEYFNGEMSWDKITDKYVSMYNNVINK